MIIDSSALIGILRDEPEAMTCAKAIEAASHRRISAANFVESAIVIDGSRDPVASRRFDDLVKEAQLVVEPVTEAQVTDRARGLPGFRSRQRASSEAEFRGLLLLRPCASYGRAAVVHEW